MPPTDHAARAARTIAGECLAVRARVLGRAITAVFDDELRPLGLTTPQLNLLVATERMGRPAPGELGATLHLEKSTLSRNLRLMEEHGWLRREAGEDGRSHALALTAAGRRLLVKALPAWTRAQERAAELLGGAGARALASAGDRLFAGG